MGKVDFVFGLAICSIIFSANLSYSGECTKAEIMKMINAGYSKSEVDEICNKTLKDPKCCCKIETYTSNNWGTGWSEDSTSTSYKWMDADDCYTTKKTSVLPSATKWERRCSSKSNCGR